MENAAAITIELFQLAFVAGIFARIGSFKTAITFIKDELSEVKERLTHLEAIAQASDSLSSGDYVTGGAMLITGLFGIFMKEKTK